MNQHSYHGLLVIDKPTGVTSRDIVNRAQRWFPRKTRIGHAGTLDPLATGVLVLCVGVATRLTEYVQRMNKMYQTRIRLGATSDTDDVDGVVTEAPEVRACSREEVDDAVKSFVGEIEQTPPNYSANKIAGKRAYDLAREGKQVALSAKTVHVYGIEIVDFQFPYLDLEIECGKGTYIRSIARDLGERLGCGGVVETLQRSRIGPFAVADALAPDADAELFRERLLPHANAVFDLPAVYLDDEDVRNWRQGKAAAFATEREQGETFECAVFDQRMELVGVGMADTTTKKIQPVKVLQM